MPEAYFILNKTKLNHGFMAIRNEMRRIIFWLLINIVLLIDLVGVIAFLILTSNNLSLI